MSNIKHDETSPIWDDPQEQVNNDIGKPCLEQHAQLGPVGLFKPYQAVVHYNDWACSQLELPLACAICVKPDTFQEYDQGVQLLCVCIRANRRLKLMLTVVHSWLAACRLRPSWVSLDNCWISKLWWSALHACQFKRCRDSGTNPQLQSQDPERLRFNLTLEVETMLDWSRVPWNSDYIWSASFFTVQIMSNACLKPPELGLPKLQASTLKIIMD